MVEQLRASLLVNCLLNVLHGIEMYLILVYFIQIVLSSLHYEYKDQSFVKTKLHGFLKFY